MAPKKSGGGGGGQKKKKVISNRGFATTSVPRKATLEELELKEAEEKIVEVVEGEENGKELVKEGVNQVSKESEEWDSEVVEKHELQALADKIRPTCDKEATRMGKVRLFLQLELTG